MSEATLPSVADLYTTYHSVILRFLSQYADPELCEEIASRVWCKVAAQGLPEKTKADSPDAKLLCIMARGELANYRRSDRSDNVPGAVWEFVPGSCDIDTSSELLESLPAGLQSLAIAIQRGDTLDGWAESQGVSLRSAYRLLAELRDKLAA